MKIGRKLRQAIKPLGFSSKSWYNITVIILCIIVGHLE